MDQEWWSRSYLSEKLPEYLSMKGGKKYIRRELGIILICPLFCKKDSIFSFKYLRDEGNIQYGAFLKSIKI